MVRATPSYLSAMRQDPDAIGLREEWAFAVVSEAPLQVIRAIEEQLQGQLQRDRRQRHRPAHTNN
jgi:hypothetical protein